MVNTVYWLPIAGPAAEASWVGPKVGDHQAPFLYSSREASELSQWLCYDDSTINIVVVIIIIIIIINLLSKGMQAETHWEPYECTSREADEHNEDSYAERDLKKWKQARCYPEVKSRPRWPGSPPFCDYYIRRTRNTKNIQHAYRNCQGNWMNKVLDTASKTRKLCYRKDNGAMRHIYIGYSTLILFKLRRLLRADLILNEFKQLGFIALIGCWYWTSQL